MFYLCLWFVSFSTEKKNMVLVGLFFLYNNIMYYEQFYGLIIYSDFIYKKQFINLIC